MPYNIIVLRIAHVFFVCPASVYAAAGKVIQVGQDFIGLLVLGVINASVAKSEMRSEWAWNGEVRIGWAYDGMSAHEGLLCSHIALLLLR